MTGSASLPVVLDPTSSPKTTGSASLPVILDPTSSPKKQTGSASLPVVLNSTSSPKTTGSASLPVISGPASSPKTTGNDVIAVAGKGISRFAFNVQIDHVIKKGRGLSSHWSTDFLEARHWSIGKKWAEFKGVRDALTILLILKTNFAYCYIS